MLMIN